MLDDLAALGCRKVHYTGGELFLRKDAVQLVEAAAERGMRTNLTTNGTALDKPRLKALLKVPVRSVTLSLDSPVNHVHDRIRGVQTLSVRAVVGRNPTLEHPRAAVGGDALRDENVLEAHGNPGENTQRLTSLALAVHRFGGRASSVGDDSSPRMHMPIAGLDPGQVGVDEFGSAALAFAQGSRAS